jgi:hypothetical protein
VSWSTPDPESRGTLTPDELWTTVHPAVSLTGQPHRLDEVTEFLDDRLTGTLDFERRDAPGAPPTVVLYQRGGRARRAFAIVAEVAVSGGGGRFNISYHVVLERVSPTELVLTVHGIDRTYRARFSPHQVFGDIFAEGGALFPDVGSTPWFPSTNLPETYWSSPAGFARLVGTRRAFWWS